MAPTTTVRVKERFEKERKALQPLEVEALDTLQRQRVLGVVEQIRIRPTLDPAV